MCSPVFAICRDGADVWSGALVKKSDNFKKSLDFIALKWYDVYIKCSEQKQVDLEKPWRELPVGARQWGRPCRIPSVSSALNERNFQ